MKGDTEEHEGRVVHWDLGTALVLLRTVAGWTQEDLARASGIRGSSISDYEPGKIVPGLKTLRRIVNAEGFPLAALEQALTFIEILLRERSLPLDAEKANVTASPPVARLFVDSAAYRQEAEKVAAEAANVVGRMVRLTLAGGYPRIGTPAPGLDPEAMEAEERT
jgi:transcriptional regulator with XRE-family HTH domain